MAKKENVNYLDLVPQVKEGLNWNKDKDGIVTLEIENKGLFNKITQMLLKKPKISYVHLDSLGSFVWLKIDGKNDIAEISAMVKEQFGDKAEPLYERVAKYFQILVSYGFVSVENGGKNNG